MSDKTIKSKGEYLDGKLLMAMPGLGDPRFHRALIFICAHDENGAMGIVVNHHMPSVEFTDLLDQLKITSDIQLPKDVQNQPVMCGGPVETTRGFVLHSSDYETGDTIKVNPDFFVTGTLDGLKDIAKGKGPQHRIFALGYAGWSAGQLEQELQQNAWLMVEADRDLLFATGHDDMWSKAADKLGIDPAMLSAEGGHA